VKLLDGGRKKWELDSRPLVTEPTERPATQVTRRSRLRTDIRAFRDEGRRLDRQAEPGRRAFTG